MSAGADQHLGTRAGLCVQASLHLEREQDVVERRAPGEEIVVLRDIADAAVDAGLERARIARADGRAVEHDLAGARDVDLRDDVEQRRLAGARRANDGEKLAIAHRERQVLDHPGGGHAALVAILALRKTLAERTHL